jgi:hypothetical protein
MITDQGVWTLDGPVERILYLTTDPTVEFHGKPVLAMTTLLHRICGDDPVRFEEATRIVELFIDAALSNVGEPPRRTE